MDDLITWLLAAIADDEQVAREATEAMNSKGHGKPYSAGSNWTANGGILVGQDGYGMWDCEGSETLVMADEWAEHAAAWDPARVLAECEAKRAILKGHTHDQATRLRSQRPELTFGCADCHMNDDGEIVACGWCYTIKALALAYVGRPGYQESWRPA